MSLPCCSWSISRVGNRQGHRGHRAKTHRVLHLPFARRRLVGEQAERTHVVFLGIEVDVPHDRHLGELVDRSRRRHVEVKGLVLQFQVALDSRPSDALFDRDDGRLQGLLLDRRLVIAGVGEAVGQKVLQERGRDALVQFPGCPDLHVADGQQFPGLVSGEDRPVLHRELVPGALGGTRGQVQDEGIRGAPGRSGLGRRLDD